jgi:hypothetical protein
LVGTENTSRLWDQTFTARFETKLSSVSRGLAARLVYTYSVPSKRFTELQDEFFETSKRLGLAQTPKEKLELLTELLRITKESKAALTELKAKKSV